jgi:toxin ParE1/3/4
MKRRSYTISSQARRDIANIHREIYLDDPRRAVTYVAELYDAIDRYARNGLTGTARNEIYPGIRYFPFGNYVVLFFVLPDELWIARVPHGARDLPKLKYPTPDPAKTKPRRRIKGRDR